VSIRLSAIESVEGVAEIPGEVGGPSLRVTVEVANTTEAAVDLSGTVVNLYLGTDRRPAIGLMKPGGSLMPSSVEPGAAATGVYVFNVPAQDRALVAVEVDIAIELPVVVFEGTAPAAG